MPAERRAWEQHELLIVFRLYCRTSFGRLHQRNPEIIELAQLIGRTPGAVAMKACNFASLDPQQQNRSIKALSNVSRADKELWEAFLADSQAVAERAEAAYSAVTGKEIEDFLPELGHAEWPGSQEGPAKERVFEDDLITPAGATEKEVLIKTRRVQSFFRSAVLTSYEHRCALTGLAVPELLNASHIIPWSLDEKRRADPRNGICLNAFHDRAFDRGLISFDKHHRVMVSSTVRENEECGIHRDQLTGLSGRPLRLPERFQPETSALDFHRETIFRP